MELIDYAFENLKDFKEVMSELEMEWWVSDGTFLGLYRDGNLIKNDHDDIDVSLWKKYASRSGEIIKKLEDKGFYLIKDWKYLDGTSEGMAIKRNGNKMDIIFNSLKNGKDGDSVVYYLADNRKKNFGSGEVYAYVFPANVLTSFSEIEWRGEKFPCPAKAEEYLTVHYGKHWDIPVYRREGYDGHNLQLNPCLRGDWEWDNPEHLF